MQDSAAAPTICVIDELNVGNLSARHVCDNLDWGQGEICPQAAYLGMDDQRALLEAVLNSIEPVQETTYSACTDGRMPIRLLDGETVVPVREQMAGADIVSAFYVAESLGDAFYEDANAPVAERIKEVAEFLKKNGLNPSSHLGCGAAANFVTIANNTVGLTENAAYMNRLNTLLPEGVYDAKLHAGIAKSMKDRLAAGVYADLTGQDFIDSVEQVSGKHAIEELRDDGRGIQGHVEEQIIRLRVPGFGINEQKLAKLTDGREVFGISDNRIERIAHLFGQNSDIDYRVAHMALEDFVDATHATLTKDLPTYVVERIS